MGTRKTGKLSKKPSLDFGEIRLESAFVFVLVFFGASLLNRVVGPRGAIDGPKMVETDFSDNRLNVADQGPCKS